MKRRFVIAVENMTWAEDRAFVEWLRTKNLEWWHWIPGFWLVATRSGDLSTEEVRNQLRKKNRSKGHHGAGDRKAGDLVGLWARYARERHVQMDSRSVGGGLTA